MNKMVSLIQSRDMGWAIELLAEHLIKINKDRVGQHSFDTEAAQNILGTSSKGRLADSSFVCIFEFWGVQMAIA